MCQCEQGIVSGVEQDFKLTLQKEVRVGDDSVCEGSRGVSVRGVTFFPFCSQTSLEDWAYWLDGVVSRALKPHEGLPSFSKAARQFLLKWSFYR